MAWVAVTKQGREFISMCKPIRVTDEDNYYGWKDTFTEISLCSGSIKKLIGRDLSWCDSPVELKEIQSCLDFILYLPQLFYLQLLWVELSVIYLVNIGKRSSVRRNKQYQMNKILKSSTRMRSIYVGYITEWCVSMVKALTLITCTALPRYSIN